MAVSAAAVTPALTPPNPRQQFVDDNGKLGVGNGSGLNVLTQHHNSINGLTPTVSCNCANVSNVLTLTPLNIAPNVPNYYSFWSFAFVSSVTSTGLVTATVVPNTGVLPTLPVMKNHGAAQATTSDLTINLFYIMYYVDTLNGGNGAFVLIG